MKNKKDLKKKAIKKLDDLSDSDFGNVDINWQEMYNDWYKERIIDLNENIVEYIVCMLTEANRAYSKGLSIMTDVEFDQWENIIKIHSPNHPFLKGVGDGRDKE